MKLNFAHIVSYVTAGLAWLAALNPTFVSGVVGPTLAPYAVATITLAGSVLVFLQHVGVIPTNPAPAPTVTVAVPPASKQAGFISVRGSLLLASAAVMILGLASACSTIEGLISSPTGATVVTAAADVAVATAESKGISAAQINAIAKTVLAADSGSSATLAALSALVTTQIAAAKLPPGDQAAADILVAALSASIQTKIAGNTSLAAAQAAVAEVLNDVILATGG
jgi:hypothetical protein